MRQRIVSLLFIVPLLESIEVMTTVEESIDTGNEIPIVVTSLIRTSGTTVDRFDQGPWMEDEDPVLALSCPHQPLFEDLVLDGVLRTEDSLLEH